MSDIEYSKAMTQASSLGRVVLRQAPDTLEWICDIWRGPSERAAYSGTGDNALEAVKNAIAKSGEVFTA